MKVGSYPQQKLDVNTYEAARKNPQFYIWGPAVNFFEVGPYRIIEYHRFITDGCIVTEKPDLTKTQFHLFVATGLINEDTQMPEFRDTCHSFNTLDAALAGGIAYRAEGPNHHADWYFMLALENIHYDHEKGY